MQGFNSQFLEQPLFSTGSEINIPVMPLLGNLSLNSDAVFWPQIRSGFVAEKQIHLIVVMFFVSLFIFCCAQCSYTCRLFAHYGVVNANHSAYW
jgi:hypothetical protein